MYKLRPPLSHPTLSESCERDSGCLTTPQPRFAYALCEWSELFWILRCKFHALTSLASAMLLVAGEGAFGMFGQRSYFLTFSRSLATGECSTGLEVYPAWHEGNSYPRRTRPVYRRV